MASLRVLRSTALTGRVPWGARFLLPSSHCTLASSEHVRGPVLSASLLSSQMSLQVLRRPEMTVARTFQSAEEDEMTCPASPAPGDVREVRAMFDRVWRRLELRGGVMSFPREIIWLNGGPGAGKSTNTEFILKVRGLDSAPIVMSELLHDDPVFVQRMERGEMIGDEEVIERLFVKLMDRRNWRGVIVDGFPRTAVQAQCLKFLRDKMISLRDQMGSNDSVLYPSPKFFIAMLYITEEESVRRQLLRGSNARKHNERVRAIGYGTLIEERSTDFDEALIRKRYRIFLQHRNTLLELQNHFRFTVIDATENIENVRDQIVAQFSYQSKEDLSCDTFQTIRKVPLAGKIRRHAWSELVARLDDYRSSREEDLEKAVDVVRRMLLPACQSAAFFGEATIKVSPDDPGYESFAARGPLFVQMCLDVLAERGYSVRYDTEVSMKPVKFDVKSGDITCEKITTHCFQIKFPGAELSRS